MSSSSKREEKLQKNADGFETEGFYSQYKEDLPFKVVMQSNNPLENRKFYSDRRHVQLVCNYRRKGDQLISDWRMKERMKTVSVALVLCLNIGIDPPDVVKTNPCAKLEAWVDPFAFPPQKALETIGRNLQNQYEVWQLRAKYKLSLDPCVEELKKLCISLRKSSREERVLFHYNGHGVPKPTPGGELWVFNKNYTQYIPVPVSDLQTWLGSPCIYVYDCSGAGNMLSAFNRFAEQRDNAAEAYRQKQMDDPAHAGEPIPLYKPLRDCIQLAACKENETLPMTPDLPADLFTACLTTPLDIGLRWFFSQNPLLHNITVDMISKVPGKHNDRRTPLGELNWIFTAITDTIAWNVLPNSLFKRLFRQDLMVAALFRNYLLAERIMKNYHCTPQSSPKLPATHQHPMWKAWDLVVDSVLSQLPNLLSTGTMSGQLPVIDYVHSSFFAEQLTAFEVWLAKGPISEEIPEQLPIVLQVLLSQVHRVRALMLLSRFLDIGPWAVNLALSVGIFPYVLKLLQSPAGDLRPVLVFIWAKILAVDRSCQTDLFKDNGYTYFINILASNVPMPNVPNLSEHRAMCAFILWVFCHNFPAGQQACLQKELLPALLQHINDPDPLLRQWVCSCLAEFWMDNSEVKKEAYKSGAHIKLYDLLNDESPEVRTAALGAIGSFIGGIEGDPEELLVMYQRLTAEIIVTGFDASPMVRKELILSISRLIELGNPKFLNGLTEILEEERKFSLGNKNRKHLFNNFSSSSSTIPSANNSINEITLYEATRTPPSVYTCIWRTLLVLSVDSFESISVVAGAIIDTVLAQMAASNFITLPSNNSNRNSAGQAANDNFGNHLTVQTGSANPLKRLSSIGLNMIKSNYETVHSADPIAELKTDGSSMRRINSMQTMSGPTSNIKATDEKTKFNIGLNPENESKNLKITFQDTPAVKRARNTFFHWNCAYFAEPQMRLTEIDDPGSYLYNERHWRRIRNKELYENSSRHVPLIESQGTVSVNSSRVIHCKFNPDMAIFHQFEPQMAISDSNDTVCIFDLDECKKIGQLVNGNPIGSKITSMRFINEHDLSLLMVGSDEGVIRLYREFGYQARPLTAWRALPEFHPKLNTGLLGGLPTNWSAKLLSDWNQETGHLVVSGGDLSIRIWAAESEICIQDIPTKNNHALTSLSFGINSSLLYAGFSDGCMSVFDRRIRGSMAYVLSVEGSNKGSSGTSYITAMRSYESYNYNALRLKPPSDAIGGIASNPIYSFPHIINLNSHGVVNVWDLRCSSLGNFPKDNKNSDYFNGSMSESTSSSDSGSFAGTPTLDGQIGTYDGNTVSYTSKGSNYKIFKPHDSFFWSLDLETNRRKAVFNQNKNLSTTSSLNNSQGSLGSISTNSMTTNGCLHENLPIVAGLGSRGALDIFSIRPSDVSRTAIYSGKKPFTSATLDNNGDEVYKLNLMAEINSNKNSYNNNPSIQHSRASSELNSNSGNDIPQNRSFTSLAASAATGFVSAITRTASSSNTNSLLNSTSDQASINYNTDDENVKYLAFHKQKMDIALVGNKKVTIYNLL